MLIAIAYPAVNSYISGTKDTTYTLHEAVVINATRHDKKTVYTCNRAVASYTCTYNATYSYSQTVKACAVDYYTCSRAAIPHYGTCSTFISYYNYWWTNLVDEDNTSCSSKASFSCNYNNANSTYTTCEFIKYTCDNGENLLGSYCYTIG